MSMEAASTNSPTIRESFEEYGRGLAGGLLFSLPLLYTMEVWWTGFLVDQIDLLVYMGASFALLLGYNRYAGLRRDASLVEVCIDSIEEMGLGLILTTLMLFLLGRLTTAMPLNEIVGKVVIEAMTVAVGISIGTAQLGGADEAQCGVEQSGVSDGTKSGDPDLPDTKAQLILAFCGAILFAANVAPTEEILMIAMEASTARLLGLVILSLMIGALVLFFSGFVGSERTVHRDGLFWTVFGVVGSYGAALIASTLMLWFFGRLAGASPLLALSQIVVLAFPAMLGASAGRVLIQ